MTTRFADGVQQTLQVEEQAADRYHSRLEAVCNLLNGQPLNTRRAEPRLQAHVDQAADVLGHDLDAALGDLREADERGVARAPVAVGQQRGQVRAGQRHDRVATQRQRHAVQALLPELVALALALALVPVAVRAVPPRVVLCSTENFPDRV